MGFLLAPTFGWFLARPIDPGGVRGHPRGRETAWRVYWKHLVLTFTRPVGSVGHAETMVLTKLLLEELAEALRAFRSDLGHFPFCGGSVPGEESWEKSALPCLTREPARNVLVERDIAPPFAFLGLTAESYQALWHGPYLKYPPDVSMVDPWDGLLHLGVASGVMFVISAGPDGVFDRTDLSSRPDYSGDDIIGVVGALQKPGRQ
jgi:hypothetical protein